MLVGHMVEFQANGRMAEGYLGGAAATGPGLVLLQEWWGLVDHIKHVADRFAAAGFVTLAPDLYHGEQATTPDEARRLRMAMNIDEACRDVRGAADYLLALDVVRPKRVAALGFCMGGQLALYAGAQIPDRIAAVVDFYGAHEAVHIAPGALHVPVLAHFGLHDRSIPPTQARALVDEIQRAGTPVEAHFYDAGHAFFNDTRPAAYDAASAELAWQRTIDFLRRHLTD